MKETQKEKKYFVKREAQLDVAYQEYLPLWRDLADYYLPRSSRFLISESNKKPKFSSKILESSTILAIKNFSSGMFSAATNPAQDWFKFGIKGFNAKENENVKNWCASVADLFRRIYNDSNVYKNLPMCYGGLGAFGLNVLAVEKDYETIINTKILPLGSYKIAKNSRGDVNTFYRFFTMSVNNLVETFGIDNVSNTVKDAYKKGNYENSIEVVHAVEPNQFYDKNSKFSDKKKYISVYYERSGTDKENNKFLEVKGFNHFPFVVFQGDVISDDVYPSDCPGITSLPDVKQLKKQVKKKYVAIEKAVEPPLKGAAKYKDVNQNPRGFTATEETGKGSSIEPIFQVDTRAIEILKIDNAELIEKIARIWFNHLFAMFTNENQPAQPRPVAELYEKVAEKMGLLAPVGQQIYDGISQLINITLEICFDIDSIEAPATGRRLIPVPPEEIQGSEIDIDFISPFARAQKAGQLAAIERTSTFAANLANSTGDRRGIYKLNVPEIIDDYADISSVEPDNIVPTDVVEARIVAEQKAQVAQAQMNAIEQGSKIVQNMGGVDAVGGELAARAGMPV